MNSSLQGAIEEIRDVMRSTYRDIPLEDIVFRRVNEFKNLGTNGETIFNFKPFLDLELKTGLLGELCFCILTANSSAVLGIKIQNEVGDDGFREMDEVELAQIFRKMGHRYPEIRARYIVLARSFDIGSVLSCKNGKKARQIALKVKGLGMKESSHFLRNIGFDDVAIVDRHIYRFLIRHKILPYNSTITPKIYMKAESVLEGIAEALSIPLPSLDLFIFFKQAGVVLK